jgi:hypothetical protein
MMNDSRGSGQDGAPPAGLCGTCAYARAIVSSRGSRFVLCERSAVDPRFPRYPRLPVLECAGHEPRPVQPPG